MDGNDFDGHLLMQTKKMLKSAKTETLASIENRKELKKLTQQHATYNKMKLKFQIKKNNKYKTYKTIKKLIAYYFKKLVIQTANLYDKVNMTYASKNKIVETKERFNISANIYS